MQTVRNRRGQGLLILRFATGLMGASPLVVPAHAERADLTAAQILGNPDYPAFSYGGYRHATREIAPTVEELKDDMKILSAMGTRLIRTYNTSQYPQAASLLKAIRELKDEDSEFEMYVMLGAWIECEGAWTGSSNHDAGNVTNNTAEIETAIDMVRAYPDIVKVIAVGNEAMVHWAVDYYVTPKVILKWVNHLRELRESGGIPAATWITSSDNFASWGGGDARYHTDELTALIEAVDFVSLHTYPFHDTHYQPAFWAVPTDEAGMSPTEKARAAMLRARDYAIEQYRDTADYITSLGIKKPIHIGETGWATLAGSSYGRTGSQAADEYKQRLYYEHMRAWTAGAGLSCFYFEAFDEKWKDSGNELGSENHFGLINLKGQAKYALWDLVDDGTFNGLTRNGEPLTKSYGGDEAALFADLLTPPLATEIGILEISTVNENRAPGATVVEPVYVITHQTLAPDGRCDVTYPGAPVKLNPWEGTCSIKMTRDGVVQVTTGTGAWWGCGLELQSGGVGEDLTRFADGHLNFEIKGTTASSFVLGFQTGLYSKDTLENHLVTFAPGSDRVLTRDWTRHSLRLAEIASSARLNDVTALLFLRGAENFDGESIWLRNIYYSRE